MNKSQRAMVIFCVVSILLVVALYVFSEKITPTDNTVYLYYGITCSHCKNVEEFILKNGIDAKLNITQKEVFENAENAQELQSVARKCGIDGKEIGVPLIYYKGRCYVGEVEGINILKKLTGMEGFK